MQGQQNIKNEGCSFLWKFGAKIHDTTCHRIVVLLRRTFPCLCSLIVVAMLSHTTHTWTRIAHLWPELRNLWPELRRLWPELRKLWSELRRLWPELRSLCKDRATDVTNEKSGLHLLQGKIILSCPKLPNRMWGPTHPPIKFLGSKAVGTRS